MKMLRDTWLIFVRNLLVTVRNPVWVFVSLAQPLFFLVLFAPLLTSVAKTPGWLRHVASVNPLSYAVDASRDLFNGHPGNVVVPQALAVMTALAALAVWWAARSFRQATA